MTDEELIEIFKNACNDKLPSCVIVNGVKYKRWYRQISTGKFYSTFVIIYSEYDGNIFNTNNTIIERWFTGEENISFADVIDGVLESLKNLNRIIIDDIIPKDQEFRRDLIKLLNSYNKESESNTPDYILAEHLISCLRNFNNSTNSISEYYGRETPNKLMEQMICQK